MSMSIARIESSIPGKDVANLVYGFFHEGKITIEGRTIYCSNPQLPVATKKPDHILWQFKSPMKVSTPGPDSSVGDIKQYKDRIEFEIWPWATVKLVFK